MIPIPQIRHVKPGEQITAVHMQEMARAINSLIQAQTEENKSRDDFRNIHPWKITRKNDDELTVGAGWVLKWETEDADSDLQSYYSLQTAIEFTGGDVTVDDDGVIYGKVSSATGDLLSKNTLTDETELFSVVNPSGTCTVHFDTAMPTSGTGQIYFEIAKVTFTDDVAKVDSQILTYNPDITALTIGII